VTVQNNRSAVTLLAVSEFGRRLHENGSRDTDHGSASVALLARSAGAAGGGGLRVLAHPWMRVSWLAGVSAQPVPE
jgi:uncharacterized protein (DUF1501 family)